MVITFAVTRNILTHNSKYTPRECVSLSLYKQISRDEETSIKKKEAKSQGLSNNIIRRDSEGIELCTSNNQNVKNVKRRILD